MVEHVNRHRPIQKKVWLNADEEKYIKRKMTNAGVKNFSTYARKMTLLIEQDTRKKHWWEFWKTNDKD